MPSDSPCQCQQCKYWRAEFLRPSRLTEEARRALEKANRPKNKKRSVS